MVGRQRGQLGRVRRRQGRSGVDCKGMPAHAPSHAAAADESRQVEVTATPRPQQAGGRPHLLDSCTSKLVSRPRSAASTSAARRLQGHAGRRGCAQLAGGAGHGQRCKAAQAGMVACRAWHQHALHRRSQAQQPSTARASAPRTGRGAARCPSCPAASGRPAGCVKHGGQGLGRHQQAEGAAGGGSRGRPGCSRLANSLLLKQAAHPKPATSMQPRALAFS